MQGLILSPGSTLSGRAYTCRVVAVTLAGEGSEAASLVEVSTLPAAPRIVEIHVDDVQHDQIQISWALPQRPQMDRSVCQTLDLSDSMDDLKVLGYSFRWSLSASWLASWTELPCVEVADIFIDELGRAHLAVTELQSEQSYIVDVRAQPQLARVNLARLSDAALFFDNSQCCTCVGSVLLKHF